jgi:hypothetical protein
MVFDDWTQKRALTHSKHAAINYNKKFSGVGSKVFILPVFQFAGIS